MKKGIIYCITNKINNKKYIGQTTNLKSRWSAHIYGKEIKIDKDINKYSFWFFKLKVLEECSAKKIDEREIYWIEKLNTYKGYGYNNSPGGKGLTLYGKDNPMYGKTGSKHHNFGKNFKEYSSIGENHPASKISNEKAIKIYNEYHNTNKTQEEVAQKYGVKRGNVNYIVTEKSIFIKEAVKKGIINKQLSFNII